MKDNSDLDYCTFSKDIFESSFIYLNYFKRAVKLYAEKVALIQGSEHYTFQDLDSLSDSLAYLLKKNNKSIKQIVFLLDNGVEFITCYLAAHKLGVIACPLNPLFGSREIIEVFNKLNPDVIIYKSDLKEKLDRTIKNTGGQSPFLIQVDESGKYSAEGDTEFNVSKKEKFECEFIEDDNRNTYDGTLVLHTSGTTGVPKLCLLNNLNELFTYHDVLMNFSLSESDLVLTTTPWCHRGGLFCCGPAITLLIGATIITTPGFDPRFFQKMLNELPITYIVGVPTTFYTLVELQKRKKLSFESLEVAISMGAPIGEKAQKETKNYVCKNLYNGYGTTETFWNTLLKPGDPESKCGSSGRPCYDDEVTVGSINGGEIKEVKNDNKTLGQIFIKAPTKFSFTYLGESISKYLMGRGWYKTGDVGKIDNEGFITVCGRDDDMLLREGECVFPEEIENVLENYPNINEAVVFGIENIDLSSKIIAHVVVEKNNLVDVLQVKRYCREHLAKYKCPDKIVIVEKVEKNMTGKKIRKFK